jgi:hypothetical protein
MPDFEKYWTKVKKMAGQCAANTDLEDLQASVELAKTRVGQALQAGQMLQKDSRVFDKLGKANERLGDVAEGLEKARNLCVGIVEANKIHEAVKILSDDRIIYDNPQAAADSFDLLFQGFGKLCSYLPPPAKQWAQFFEEFNLFGNMQKKVYAPYFKRLNDINSN